MPANEGYMLPSLSSLSLDKAQSSVLKAWKEEKKDPIAHLELSFSSPTVCIHLHSLLSFEDLIPEYPQDCIPII